MRPLPSTRTAKPAAPAAPPRSSPLPPAAPEHRPLPVGYRQGIITAISVLLGFSLAFWRFWGFESPGEWNLGSLLVAVSLVAAVVLQIVALFRSLRVEDDDVHEYRTTVRWLVASTVAMLACLCGAIAEDFINGSGTG